MDTDPHAHSNNPTLPRSPRRTHLRAHRHQSKSDVAERPHHSHPVNQAIKIATSTRLAPRMTTRVATARPAPRRNVPRLHRHVKYCPRIPPQEALARLGFRRMPIHTVASASPRYLVGSPRPPEFVGCPRMTDALWYPPPARLPSRPSSRPSSRPPSRPSRDLRRTNCWQLPRLDVRSCTPPPKEDTGRTRLRPVSPSVGSVEVRHVSSPALSVSRPPSQSRRQSCSMSPAPRPSSGPPSASFAG